MNTYLNTVNQDTLTQINELKILEDRMQKKKNDFYYMMQEYQRLENVFEENKQNKLKLANQIVE